jgi:hypothetical protein
MSSLLADMLRPHWLPGLNDVSENVYQKLSVWVMNNQYQIYNQIQTDQFQLDISDEEPLLKAFAYDCSRMSMAAIETIDSISTANKLSKSRAWLIIQFYYAAFYAAHSILRTLGIACTQLDKPETNNIERIATLFGTANGVTIESGFYQLTYDDSKKALCCKKLNTPQSGGSHEKMWVLFQATLRRLSNDILAGAGPSVVKQNVSNKLVELCDALAAKNSNWLSFIRNMTTYRHEYSTWYPYSNYDKYYDHLSDIVKHWKEDPMTLTIWPQKNKELQRFMEACGIIISISYSLVDDMASRCSKGKSFLTYGPLAVINHLNR